MNGETVNFIRRRNLSIDLASAEEVLISIYDHRLANKVRAALGKGEYRLKEGEETMVRVHVMGLRTLSAILNIELLIGSLQSKFNSGKLAATWQACVREV